MSTAIQKRPRIQVPTIDTENEPDTIRLAKAIKAGIKCGFSQDSLAEVPHQEVVGKFLKQHSHKAITSAMFKRSADNASHMIATCDEKIVLCVENEDDPVELKIFKRREILQWERVKTAYEKLYQSAALGYYKVAGKELEQQVQDARPRTPSFPANANVSAPVMAQQVNVVVHQHEKE